MSAVEGARNIVLGGLMGTGKTTIARRLAITLGRPWLDTDTRVEQDLGVSVAELFARDGEQAFREREATVVRDAAAAAGGVISLGGGVLLDPANVAQLRASGVIVLLTGDAAELARRAARRGLQHRPLLADVEPEQLSGRLAELAEQRRERYEAAADHVEDTTDGRSPEQVAAAIIAWAAERGDVLSSEERKRVAA